MFSFDKTDYAGNFLGILSGIIVPPLFIVIDILYTKYGKNSIFSHEIICYYIINIIILWGGIELYERIRRKK